MSAVCVCAPKFSLGSGASHTSVFSYLSSRLSLPEMKGRRRMTSWRKFFVAWHPGRALSAAGQDYWCGRKRKIPLFIFILDI